MGLNTGKSKLIYGLNNWVTIMGRANDHNRHHGQKANIASVFHTSETATVIRFDKDVLDES